jgi:hypothetical protein
VFQAAPDDDSSSTSTVSRDVVERDGEKYRLVKRDEFTDFFRNRFNESPRFGRKLFAQFFIVNLQ